MIDEFKVKNLKAQANKLPLTPGVYIMKNKQGEIIYVGKAKALKNRVTQYFGSITNHSVKVIKMVDNVDSFETILCNTEYEALLLENSLIKQHQPKYNILLKDDKGYHYIKITNERWPKILAVKNKLNDSAEYIGPYYSFSVVRETVDEVLKLYRLPDCSRSFDRKTKPCLNSHIGLCTAPCCGKISHSEYIETINSAKNYIKNGGQEDIDLLKQKMEKCAENLEFEHAARLRDRINALIKIRQKQNVIISAHKREDVFATAVSNNMSCVAVFVFEDGRLVDKRIFNLDISVPKSEFYAEFLMQYYENSNNIPPHISIDSDFEDRNLIEEWLHEVKGSSVIINVPIRGQQKSLVDMCLNNAAQALADKISRNVKETAAISELTQLLGLDKAPKRIESYDISNTSGKENVGSMVVFIDGRPDKNLYRKFRIKSFIGQDDFRSLAEVLNRRIDEYYAATDNSFKHLPDLVLLDGGKGQLSAVKSVFESRGIFLPIFGMVKDSKHKTRAITAGGEDIQIKSNRKAYTLVSNLQEEVHRVAISYHRQRNKMSTLQLELTKIKGVGPSTAKKLISQFKTIKAVRSASLEELINVGINKPTAQNIVNFFQENK